MTFPRVEDYNYRATRIQVGFAAGREIAGGLGVALPGKRMWGVMVKSMTLASCAALAAVMSFALSGHPQAATPWDFQALGYAPKVYEAPTQEPGVRALYFESVPFKSKPTRVFAYYGAPAGKKLPAMVLVHGGGGTAFAEWVRIWNRRGYAAIAMDTC